MKTRTLWPYGIIAAFVCFFAGMITLVTIASTHPEHLVSNNYYEHELKFQHELDSAARAKASGAAIHFDATHNEVLLTLPLAQLVKNLSGTVELYRADAPDQDRSFTLQPSRDGTQRLDVAKFAAGPWLFRASWDADGQGYYLEQKFVIPAH